MKSLRKGLTLPDHKYRSLSDPKIKPTRPPRMVNIILNQHTEVSLTPCVGKGDAVYVGTKIADAQSWFTAPVHSSVSGLVVEASCRSVVIESDEMDRLHPEIQPRHPISSDARELIQIIRDNGVVDLDGACMPAHLHLNEALEKGIQTLILNGCESEPFLTADYLLMLDHALEILKGAELLRVASGAKEVVIVVEKDKLEAVELLNSKNYNLKLTTVRTHTLPTRYPQGSERELIKTFTPSLRPSFPSKGRELGEGGVLVFNVATAFAVYEAVYLRKPFYERVVTVTGPCIMEPKNLWARIGTSAGDLIRACKGLMRDPERIIFGGPMTGRAIEDLKTPINSSVQGIIALSADEIQEGKEEPCIRCGLCVDVCPENLIPETIVRAVRRDNKILAQEYAIDFCTECGLCAYICPSKIPIVSIIRDGRSQPFKKHMPEPVHTLSSHG